MPVFLEKCFKMSSAENFTQHALDNMFSEKKILIIFFFLDKTESCGNEFECTGNCFYEAE